MAELQQITNGNQQASFRRFKLVIPAGKSEKFDQPYNYFRCYEATFDFEVSWSSNSSRTSFGAGLGIKFDETLGYVIFHNPGATPLTIVVGMGIGYFDDSRLSVSGTVNTNPAPYDFFTTSQATITDGTATVPAAAKTIIQNTGSNKMFIGAANGLQLLPMGTFECNLDSELTIYGTDGDTLAIGSFN